MLTYGDKKEICFMKRKIKVECILAMVLCCSLFFSGCSDMEDSKNFPQQSVDISATPNATFETILNEDDLFGDIPQNISADVEGVVDIKLSGNSVSCESEAVTTDGSRAVICAGGTFSVSGSLDDGMIIVEAEKKDVTIILNGADITSKTSAPVYVRKAASVTFSLSENTTNKLTNGGSYKAIDENNIDSVIFSKGDLVFTGSGTLEINAAEGHGIVSKDTLSIVNGSYSISSKSHGITANDCIKIGGGKFNIASGKDGIHVENSDNPELGYMCITQGDFTLNAEGDGISSSAYMQITGGKFNVVTGGGSKNGTTTGGDSFGGGFRPGYGSSSQTQTTDTVSTKGIKAGGNIVISSGMFTIDSKDDSIHSNSSITIDNCTADIKSGDDGIHCDNALIINGGNINVTKSYEGLEGLTIDINNGDIKVVSSDDGLNAAGGNDSSGFGGRGGAFDSDGSAYIKFNGGKTHVNAGGDGVDSNGSIIVNGGEVYVSGPTNSGNGALDYGISAVATGGTFIAVGSSGMATGFGTASTQGGILLNVGNQSADSNVTIKDSNGKIMAEYSPEKTYSSAVITCPGMKTGETYTIIAGSYSQSITLTSIVYGSSGGMQGGGMPGGNRPW